jgi:hypothetical protein
MKHQKITQFSLTNKKECRDTGVWKAMEVERHKGLTAFHVFWSARNPESTRCEISSRWSTSVGCQLQWGWTTCTLWSYYSSAAVEASQQWFWMGMDMQSSFFDFAFMITPHYDLCEAISAFLLDYLNTSCWSLCTWSSSSLCCPI